MMRRIAMCLVSVVLSAPAWAQEPEPVQEEKQQQQQSQSATGGSGQQAMPMDLSKMGPWTRKPANEAKTRKEIQAFLKEENDIMKRRDFEASLARVDFPIYMATDDSKGMPKTETYDRQRYTEMMKPMFDQMPADTEVRSRPDITVLSDSMAVFTDNYTMTSGGKKYSGRNAGLLVKEDGQWKWKAFFEAGWGDMPETGVGGSGQYGQEEEVPKK